MVDGKGGGGSVRRGGKRNWGCIQNKLCFLKKYRHCPPKITVGAERMFERRTRCSRTHEAVLLAAHPSSFSVLIAYHNFQEFYSFFSFI